MLQGAARPLHEEDEEEDDMDEEDEEVAYQDDEELDAEEDIGVGSMEVHDMHLGTDGPGSLPAAPIAPPEPEPPIARWDHAYMFSKSWCSLLRIWDLLRCAWKMRINADCIGSCQRNVMAARIIVQASFATTAHGRCSQQQCLSSCAKVPHQSEQQERGG